MLRNLLLLFLFVFAGCKDHGLINESSIKMIKAVRYRTPTDSITQTFTTSGEIAHIVKGLNSNKKEPVYFTAPDCDIYIIYRDSTLNVLCRGNAIKYKGATYRLKNSVAEILY